MEHHKDHLKELHPVPQFDPHILFSEAKHEYTVHGEKYTASVTGFIHSFFSHFDPDEVIAKMKKSSNWNPNNKYYSMSDEEIKATWNANKEECSSLGTAMHEKCEKFYNIPELYTLEDEASLVANLSKYYVPADLHTVEMLYFFKYHLDWPIFHKWKPFRTELRVFDIPLRIAGSVDMLYWSPLSTSERPSLIMVDWKRSKCIKTDSFRGQTGTGPCSELKDCNYTHYSLQLNLYTAIIERNTSYRIDAMFIAVFHPNANHYVLYPVPRHFEVIMGMIDARLEELSFEAS